MGEFNDLAKNDIDLYPADLEDTLKELNDSLVYPFVNNGVYKCGFARSQESYDEAILKLFDALERLEERLSKTRYLTGRTFTWLDLRLFMTLVRFDPVYITYFKTNKKRLADYPNLLGYVRDIYSIVPAYDGPDLEAPHGRENL